MRILVTGAAGFIGSHAAEALRKGGHQVLGVDNFATGKLENLDTFVKIGGGFVHMDICQPEMSQLFEDFEPEAVIHLAAQSAITTSMKDPQHDLNVNIAGTLQMVLLAARQGVKRFVLASTSAVYKEYAHSLLKTGEQTPYGPKSPYGVSKCGAELYVQALFPAPVILRFGNVYGPRQTPIGENQVIALIGRHFEMGDQFYIHGDGKQARDFIYVGDVVTALAAALTETPGTYNVASGQSISINEIARMMAQIEGVPGYAWEHTQIQDPRRKVCLDISGAYKGLRWRPEIPIFEGLRLTVAWWKEKAKKERS